MSNEVVSKSDARVLEFMQAGKSSVVVDPQQAQIEILRRILASDSIADVLEQTEAIHAKDVLGEALLIVGTRFQESDFGEAGPDFYMLIDCTTGDGEPFSITCGAVNVMAQLFRLGQLDAFPMLASLVETEKTTKAGYKPMWLAPISDPDVKPFDPEAKAKDF